MPLPPDPHEEYRALDARLRTTGLSPEERARWEALRAAGADRPAAGDTGFDVAAAAAAFHSALPPEADRWEAPAPRATSVAFGPEDDVPEAAAGDFEEVLDPTPAPAELPPLVLPIDSEPSFHGAAIPLDELAPAAPEPPPSPGRPTPPPPGARALSAPLPPPGIASARAGSPGLRPGNAGPLPARTPPMTELLGDAPSGSPGGEGAPLRASFVAGEHRVVVHTIEGQVVRGILADADLEAREIPTVQPSGEVVRLPAAHVKAIFFMLAPGEPPPPAEGTRVRVVFGDGRQVAGLSPDFSPTAPGFFVIPVDVRSNTGRVWVFREAVRQVSVG